MSIENHVVNFSGGRTSAYMVWLFEERKKRENINVEYIYCDTGAEHPKTYQFINDVVNNFGIELTCLRTVITCERGIGPKYEIVKLSDCKQDLKPFLDVCRKHGTPTVAAPLCSDRMKSIPADKYCDDKYGRGGYIRWLGMRIDEQSRIKSTIEQMDLFSKTKKVSQRVKNTKYLAYISDFEKQDVLDWWEEQGFDLDLEEHLGNCVFCIKKGANKIALAAKDEPEMAINMINMINMINSDEVAIRPTRDLPQDIMYRDHHSLESIINAYKDIPRSDIIKGLRGRKSFETGSCSESCEAGLADPDLFDI